MYPGEKSNFILSEALTKSHQRGGLYSDSESTEDEDVGTVGFNQGNIYQEMVHVALRIRKDLTDSPGHSSSCQGLDQEHVAQVIPNSLPLFLHLLFSNVDDLHEGNEEDNSIKQSVCSIAQDIVYAVSKKRKLTPKHSLGLALYQATHSEALLDLFHTANHTIGIDTVQRIDTSIAQNILQRFVKNGNVYIPDNIIKEQMIHCSGNNIDVLEATLDGKNTFHCTQMLVWQKGPAQQQKNKSTHIQRSRAIKPDSLQAFHTLDHATLSAGDRPSLSYTGATKIEVDWFGQKIKKDRRHE